MHIATYLGLLHGGENALADTYDVVRTGHADEAGIAHTCRLLAAQCRAHVNALAPIVERYGEHREDEPDRLHAEALPEARTGGVGLLRDLQDLLLLATLVDCSWTAVCQAAQALHDHELIAVVAACQGETKVQQGWLTTQLKAAAPQALLVAR
ncbi:hypothetical protein ACFQY4_17685 [Catellatospora bangladeshensis]|uniref:DUF892 family protein n=1 Tax=Catellatospora bangladeshensis TaxID=310355 RepID=A0A8J3JD37_9ACTN|nr:hypothetical protein [Catellatospora bangladeshensis]GIF82146.1 hypothetical protein Cba03nite_34950 [Catellatospora bangladeshensis]